MKGLAKLQGGSARKFPVTAGMLRWLGSQYQPDRVARRAVMWATLMLAWFFLMRLTEYAWSGRGDYDEVLAGLDIAPKKAGSSTAF